MSHEDVIDLIRDSYVDDMFGRDIVLYTVSVNVRDRIATVPRFRLSESARSLFSRS